MIDAVRVHEGDLIVLTHPGKITREGSERVIELISATILKSMGINVAIVVLQEGMQVHSVLSKTSGERKPI